jgi:hypothetical protein
MFARWLERVSSAKRLPVDLILPLKMPKMLNHPWIHWQLKDFDLNPKMLFSASLFATEKPADKLPFWDEEGFDQGSGNSSDDMLRLSVHATIS